MNQKVKRQVELFVSAVVKGSSTGRVPVVDMFTSRQLRKLEAVLERGLILSEVIEAGQYYEAQLLARQPD